MNNLIIMGMPAAGKGTACARLASELGYEHISTGDMLRHEQSIGSKIGKLADKLIDTGGYMPDDVIISMVKERVIGSVNSVGFLFDGFPRTKEQAKQLHAFLVQRRMPIAKVVFLDVNENEAIERINARARKQGRPDDSPEVIKKRLKEYREKTAPLVDFFEKRGLLHRVPSTNGIDIMCENVIAAIEEHA